MADREYMKICLRLAGKGRGEVNPNPMVGAVVVKDGRIIGKGFHRMAGLPHAEVEAIREAGKRSKGASLYINLEPCRHYGRTPPCTKAIIRSGIKKVYAAMLDPNPLNNGKGIKELVESGIKVKVGILEDEARQLNEVFVKFITRKMPFVVVKAAQSLDGKIATITGESKWISSERSRRFVKRLRSEVDAVLVGVNTIIKDDPLLNRRGSDFGRFSRAEDVKPYYKVILDSTLRIPQDAKVFSQDSDGRVVLATTRLAPKSRVDSFRDKAEVLITRDKRSRVDLPDLMRRLAKKGVSHLLIEGGGETIASALEARVADKVLFFISPRLIGGRKAPTSVEGNGVKLLKDTIRISGLKIRRFEQDILVEGLISYKLKGAA